MGIQTLMEADGFSLKQVSNTNGGESAGACPWCGGKDRFRVWPSYKGGKYWCRGCGKRGDAIQYLRDFRGVSYQEAGQMTGIHRPFDLKRPGGRLGQKDIQGWFPKVSIHPSTAWQYQASIFMEAFVEALWSDHGRAARDFLYGRGLSDETICNAGIGLNVIDRFRPRESWGLPRENREDGKPKKLWIPAGIIIPCITDGAIQRLRVRRVEKNIDPKYVIVSGSSMAPLFFPSDGGVIIIVESELDAILLHQEAGNLVTVIAMGSAQAKPNKETDELLQKATTILLSLDADEAGVKTSWSFWMPTYVGKVKRWPVPFGKDPGEAYQKGLDLRCWIVAGLSSETADVATKPAEMSEHWKDTSNIIPFPITWRQQLNETQLERLAIMTIDGGLTDSEAVTRLDQSNGR